MLSLTDKETLQPSSYSPTNMWHSLAQTTSESSIMQTYGQVWRFQELLLEAADKNHHSSDN